MLVTLVIIASKAVGFIREMVAAHYFGTQPEYDAYVAAYALFYIPVLLLNSCITSTLVPMYTEARARRGLERADRFASNAINILALIALGVTVNMASSSATMASSRCLILDMPLSSLMGKAPLRLASHGAFRF